MLETGELLVQAVIPGELPTTVTFVYKSKLHGSSLPQLEKEKSSFVYVCFKYHLEDFFASNRSLKNYWGMRYDHCTCVPQKTVVAKDLLKCARRVLDRLMHWPPGHRRPANVIAWNGREPANTGVTLKPLEAVSVIRHRVLGCKNLEGVSPGPCCFVYQLSHIVV